MNDKLEPLMHRRVIYTVTDQDGIYTGTVERDSNGRAYVQDDNVEHYVLTTDPGYTY